MVDSNRVDRARREVIREKRSYDRILARFLKSSPSDKSWDRIKIDLAQQKHQFETALDALENALHGQPEPTTKSDDDIPF